MTTKAKYDFAAMDEILATCEVRGFTIEDVAAYAQLLGTYERFDDDAKKEFGSFVEFLHSNELCEWDDLDSVAFSFERQYEFAIERGLIDAKEYEEAQSRWENEA